MLMAMRSDRFHGRIDTEGRACEMPGCDEAGEFRAPGTMHGFDGPGQYRWFCLDHVREFNSDYDWFEGMSAEQIYEAQAPGAGWRTESPAFRPTAGIDGMPRWSDFDDPLEAIAARANGIRSCVRREVELARDGRFSRDEAQALEVMGLGLETDRGMLRRRYTELVRRFHPDRNGGDRRYEAQLGKIVEAYQLLRKCAAIAG